MNIYLLSLLVAFSVSTAWVDYVDKEANFKIAYPENWIADKQLNIWMFLAPKENEDDVFQENVNLIIQDLSAQPMSLDEFTKTSVAQYNAMPETVKLLSVGDAKMAGHEAKTAVLTMDYLGLPLKLKQYWFIVKNKAYLFTYTAHESTYSRYEADGTKLMLGFQFIK